MLTLARLCMCDDMLPLATANEDLTKAPLESVIFRDNLDKNASFPNKFVPSLMHHLNPALDVSPEGLKTALILLLLSHCNTKGLICSICGPILLISFMFLACRYPPNAAPLATKQESTPVLSSN